MFWSDPDLGFIIRSDTDSVFKLRSDLDTIRIRSDQDLFNKIDPDQDKDSSGSSLNIKIQNPSKIKLFFHY